MKVLVKRTTGELETMEIENNLKDLQGIVGGYIETVLLSPRVVVIVNEEGKMNGLPFNFNWYRQSTLVDKIVGDAVFVGVDGEDFDSLTDDEIEIIKAVFLGDNNENFHSL